MENEMVRDVPKLIEQIKEKLNSNPESFVFLCSSPVQTVDGEGWGVDSIVNVATSENMGLFLTAMFADLIGANGEDGIKLVMRSLTTGMRIAIDRNILTAELAEMEVAGNG